MGSYNIQCKVSGGSILEDDEVVTLLLEPNSEDGSFSVAGKPFNKTKPHFLIASLPVIGKYADFGKTEAASESDATRLSKSIYDYDFSEETNDNYGNRGQNICLDGEYHDFEEKAYVWTIKKCVYDALINNSEITSANSKELFENKSHLLHDRLIKEVASNELKDDSLLNLTKLINGLEILGYEFMYQGSNSHGRSYQGEIKKLAKNKILSPSESESIIPTYVCSFTGKSIAPGETVRVFPIQSRISDHTNPVHLNSHTTTGINGLAGISFDAKVNEDGTLTHGSLTTWQERLLTISEKNEVLDSQTALKRLEEGNLSIPGTKEYKDIMIVSKTAFDALESEFKSEYFNDFLIYSKMLIDAFEIDQETLLDKDLLIKYGKDNNLKFIEDTARNQSLENNHEYMQSLLKNNEPEKAKEFMASTIRNDIVRDALLFGVPVKDSQWNRHNQFCESLDDRGILGDKLSRLFNYSIRESSGRNGSKDKILSTLANLKSIAQEIDRDAAFVNALSYYSMQITPSNKTSGSYSVNQQHLIASKIDTAIADHVVESARERDVEIGL